MTKNKEEYNREVDARWNHGVNHLLAAVRQAGGKVLACTHDYIAADFEGTSGLKHQAGDLKQQAWEEYAKRWARAEMAEARQEMAEAVQQQTADLALKLLPTEGPVDVVMEAVKPRKIELTMRSHADWNQAPRFVEPWPMLPPADKAAYKRSLPLKITSPEPPKYVGLFPDPVPAVPERKIRNTCQECNSTYNKTFAYYYPCGHSIVVREWLSPIPVGGGLLEDSWLAASQGNAARHPLREGALAELRKKLGT
jgi:hypothetical protein